MPEATPHDKAETTAAHQQTWVVIAGYNEATQIENTIRTLAEFGNRIVYVDDGSDDASAAVATKAGAHVLQHIVNLGQGAALQTGIDYALQCGAAYIATFDADGQHDAADIPVMLRELLQHQAEVALGSRFLGKTIGLSQARRRVLKIAILFTNLTTGLRLTDTHNGLRLLTRHAAQQIRIQQNRMAHASEILSQIAEKKLRFIEVPMTIRYTSYSQQKGQRLSNSFNILLDLIMGRL